MVALAETVVPGSEIDGFMIDELVHSGRMGRVCRVRGPEGEAALLMKLPRTERGSGGEGLLAFETELSILPLLSGPHVPRFVAAGPLTKTPYLVVEWIEGESLEALLRGAGPLPAAVAARYGAAVGDALHSLHAQGAVHLDLKPENVILRASGEAALIDFGMAHHVRVPDLLAEEKRFASGSAPYVSPEQVQGLRSDSRSDLFALGVMLYEMATGELPFGSPQTLAGLRDRLWLDPLPPRARTPAIPGWYQEIVLRCLEPSAESRYQSAAHVAFDLRHPEQVPLTDRATKARRAAFLSQVRRWWSARPGRLGTPSRAPNPMNAPLLMVAVDTMHPDDPRHPAIRQATARILASSADFRLVCVSVVRGEPVAPSSERPGIHLEHLVRLRHWAEPLQIAAGRLSLHVLESLHASAALLDFARSNNVDLIVIGAPGPAQQALGWWRSVASGVSANAPCSVYVVRLPEPAEA
ncbi:MAG TPA: bifunctional serine/threonine-protein kinase/universal stress protein [Burkholderiales bacterium]|nr:bifunctional serine/threonine-protein kinase/universal stress protein [Burkholderiales bacterium]